MENPKKTLKDIQKVTLFALFYSTQLCPWLFYYFCLF